MAAVIFYRKYH